MSDPRTDPIPDGNLELADKNIMLFGLDMQLVPTSWERAAAQDMGGGRFAFTIWYRGRHVLIQMPGVPLESVRYQMLEGQNIDDFPHVYVNGSSYVWIYACEMAHAVT